MLTAEGCQNRRRNLLEQLQPTTPLLLAHPLNLRYFANFFVDTFALGAEYSGCLLIQPNGSTELFYDHRVPKTVDEMHVDEKTPIQWYDGQSPGQGPRPLLLREAVMGAGTDGRIHDSLQDELAPKLWTTVSELRRAKMSDEVAMLRACMKAGEAGQAWARENAKVGMTEFDVYRGVADACMKEAGHAVVVYGDFAVSPGSEKRGGPPTNHLIEAGETLILDFSVVIRGYRSDFTNTLVVGAEPTKEQRNLVEACQAAMAAGEQKLKAGIACQAVYDAVRGPFEERGLAESFPHHAGHGLGLAHPEPPYLVRQSTETLIAGDVVTLEPGLYVDGVGGCRIEHNYLITEKGFDRLSNHVISLD